jgi:hypothetical protein
MNEWLEELVPRRDEQGDWADVLRRARPRPRRRLVFAVAVLVAVLVTGPALGVLLTRDGAPRLPGDADRRNVVVVVQPLTGRIVVQAAPWKGHDGICYVLVGIRAGCAPRGTAVLTPALVGFTFDRRVVSGKAVTLAGKPVPLVVRHFEKLDVTFFFTRGRLPRLLREATLFAANGKVVARLRVKR